MRINLSLQPGYYYVYKFNKIKLQFISSWPASASKFCAYYYNKFIPEAVWRIEWNARITNLASHGLFYLRGLRITT